MTRPSAPLRWAAACLAATLLAPATAQAQSANGGTSAPTGNAALPPSALGGASPIAPAATGPNTLQAPGGAIVGGATVVRGRLTAGQAGRRVLLQVSDAQHGWVAAGAAKADANGAFAAPWRPRSVGRFMLRALAAGRAAAGDLAAAPTTPVEVYRSVIATYFGPGSYGARTACGQILTPQLLGVAHRTLPCGTMVDIAYRGQTISVPVVDRGPYANGATYDLTAAAAAALGITETVHIGALVVRSGLPPAS
ncbi:MAG: septal ring lytic transglycosylase RlpA family protein [Solirubrobacteraceae bacterium]